MKKLLLFLLFTSITFAQTSMKQSDIDAAAGSEFETLLTNVEYGINDTEIQGYLQQISMVNSGAKFSKDSKESWQYRFQKGTMIGAEQQGYINVKLYKKVVPQYSLPMTTKVEIWGDAKKVVEFYCGFWSRKLNFADVKPGETVTTRFLTDVATLSFVDVNTAKITVVTAKDR